MGIVVVNPFAKRVISLLLKSRSDYKFRPGKSCPHTDGSLKQYELST